jgi:hypothetical protein
MDAAAAPLWPTLATIAVLALAMVGAMVQFTTALLAVDLHRRPPPAPHGVSPARFWGVLYAALWISLLAGFFHLFALLGGDGRRTRNVGFLVLFALGWLGFNALFIAFARALARVQQRTAPPTGRPRAADVGRTVADTEPSSLAGEEHTLRERLASAATLVAILALVAVGEAVPALKALEPLMDAHRRALLFVTVPLGVAGWLLLVGGGIYLVLSRGLPMSREEVEAMERRRPGERLAGGGRGAVARWSGSVYRFHGVELGAEAREEASFAEVKAAWRHRAWRFSPRWRGIFTMAAGAAALTFGLFGSLLVIAPAGVKLLIAAALAYAVVRTASGFARA